MIDHHNYQEGSGNQIGISEMNVVEDDAQILVAYPQGLTVEDFWGISPASSAPGWLVPGQTAAEHDDLAFTNRLIDSIAADFRVDPNRIHATGWGNGAEMALYLARELSDRIASVASVSGHMFSELLDTCQPERPISALTPLSQLGVIFDVSR